MAKLVFGMNQSLDGYVDHMRFAPGPTLFRHFVEQAQGEEGERLKGAGKPWAAWRKQPKWVVSRSLKEVGPNARLVGDDLEGAIRELKAEREGEIEVAGPEQHGAA